eukprot:1146957-Pelagomonas_calceolata.AAC.1
MLMSSHVSHNQLARGPSPLVPRGRPHVLKPRRSAKSCSIPSNQDALYTIGASLPSFFSEKLSLELTDYGGLGFKANAPISAGDLLLTTPPIKAVWAEVRRGHTSCPSLCKGRHMSSCVCQYINILRKYPRTAPQRGPVKISPAASNSSICPLCFDSSACTGCSTSTI